MRGGGLTLIPLVFMLACTASLLWAADAKVDTTAASDTKREACIRACNYQRTICGEASATRFETYGESNAVIGAAATCDYDLRRCLKDCH